MIGISKLFWNYFLQNIKTLSDLSNPRILELHVLELSLDSIKAEKLQRSC